MTNHEAWTLYESYLEGWKAISDEERVKLAEEIVAADVDYCTRNHDAGDRRTVLADMAAFQQRFPGGHFDVADVAAHHDVALLTWVLVQADGTEFARGHDQISVSTAGKIKSLITFPPSVSQV